MQRLLSLPPAMVSSFHAAEGRSGPEWFIAADPEGGYLGSGGATAHLLAEAWKSTGGDLSFTDWLRDSSKIILHGGGQSRRLPAYAPVGKPFIPLPIDRHSYGQALDQYLIDAQIPFIEQALSSAPPCYCLAIASGDVLLRSTPIGDDLPVGDVLIFGMRADPETAKDFGVIFMGNAQDEIAYFLQKPAPTEIIQRAKSNPFLVDTGLWLLSERAVLLLMEQCGWNADKAQFASGGPGEYELYAKFGTGLGTHPSVQMPSVEALTSRARSLERPEFYHLGTSRQLIESLTHVQNRGSDAPEFRRSRAHPERFVLSSSVDCSLSDKENHTIWIENSTIPDSWQLSSEHLITGVPSNDWEIDLTAGVCLDVVPIGDSALCLRAYGIDDRFAGPIGAPGTTWLGRPAVQWFEERGLSLLDAGIDPDCDIQQCALFPVAAMDAFKSDFVQWLLSPSPQPSRDFAARWQTVRRLSARDLARLANVERLNQQRVANHRQVIAAMAVNHVCSPFFRMDLARAADLVAQDATPPIPTIELSDSLMPIESAKSAMFEAAILRKRSDARWEQAERLAFERLAASLVKPETLGAAPERAMMDDQIVWARSPARLDLAGGWTDTPPYCLEHGGQVVNMGVNLNGQPPVQVFVKPCERPELVVRSIDLGVEEHLFTYEQLDAYALPGSEFALARAAFALAGFVPRFCSGRQFNSLEAQLKSLGGGLEVTLLAAVPKGSGLGTSSILALTLLAALSNACGLKWDTQDLIRRSLVLEQMLTTGGGWQDQAGAVFRGVKLLSTSPGFDQSVSVRWLPDHLFSRQESGRSMLLYYTGITRLAKNLLQEIVRGMFLNRGAVLETVAAIGHNADAAFQAIQSGSYEALCKSVARSWELNRRLDAGTCPAAVEQALSPIKDYVAGLKLLGAGGGGYCLMLAKDQPAAARIRQILLSNPPNDRARFVDFAVSETGLQVTRS